MRETTVLIDNSCSGALIELFAFVSRFLFRFFAFSIFFLSFTFSLLCPALPSPHFVSLCSLSLLLVLPTVPSPLSVLSLSLCLSISLPLLSYYPSIQLLFVVHPLFSNSLSVLGSSSPALSV